MKSSLTLVPSTDTAVKAEDPVPLPSESLTGDGAEAKPHLRLVGPDNQADFIKEAVAAKPKRKPRKRKADTAESTNSSSTANEKAAEKKPRKAVARKPRPSKANASTQKSTDVLLPEDSASTGREEAIGSLINLLSQIAESKAESLIEIVIRDLGEEAPVELSVGFQGPADPRIIADFSVSVDSLLSDVMAQKALDSTASAEEPLTQQDQIPLRVLGPMIVSQDNDPFELTEWTLFEENFASRWYDSKSEAMEALQSMMTEAGLNYACETKLISRFFSLQDYVYKRYSITAVVGVYADYTECADQEQCSSQDAKIDNVIVPEAQIAFDKAQALHAAERKAQMKPESRAYDHFLKWFPIACYVALALGLLNVALETGFFG